MKDQIDELYPPTYENNRARNVFIKPLIKRYQETKMPFLAKQLEEYGFCIDEKDYGADQNVEKGQVDY